MEEIFCIYFSMKKFRIILLLLFCLSIQNCSPRGKVPPKALNGILDLRDWDFSEPSLESGTDPSAGSGVGLQGIEDQSLGSEAGLASEKGLSTAGETTSESSGKKQTGIVKLDGEWEFYWKEFPTVDEKGELQLPEDKRDYMDVPRPWNGKVLTRKTETGELIEETLGGEGYATYRLKILLSKRGKLAFRVPDQGTAYILYAYNKILSKSGSIGKTSEESKPSRNIKYISIVLPSDLDELTLIISISNFHISNGGFWQSTTMGKEDDILKNRESNLNLDIFVTGVLLIMGIYHLSLYTLRRDDRSPLYFGIFCLLITLRTLLTGEKYLHSILPILSFSISFSLEFITMYIGIPIFVEFLYSLYPEELNERIRNIIKQIQFILCLTILIFPPLYFSKTLPIVQVVLLLSILYTIYTLFKAMNNKRDGASIFLIGFLIFS
ncbi:MAG: membrane protein, partial [Spirochaetia bacterium]|nr:membrane protein [Spirochaetia bacterium]